MTIHANTKRQQKTARSAVIIALTTREAETLKRPARSGGLADHLAAAMEIGEVGGDGKEVGK